MYYMVIGLGPNGLEIPLLLFTDKEEAEELLDDNFERREGRQETCRWRTNDGSAFLVRDENDCNHPSAKARMLFKDGHYYGGCGDCDSLKLVEVKEGEPIVGWDLD